VSIAPRKRGSRRASRLPRVLASLISNPGDVVAVTRIAAWALVLPALKRLLPLPALARLMWVRPRVARRDAARERHVSGLVRRVYRSGLVARDDNCLERSLQTYRCLARLNAQPTLVAGVRREDERVLGHVWVTVDGVPVAESEEGLAPYSPIVAFGAEGARQAG
jgi:hypothetical protein